MGRAFNTDEGRPTSILRGARPASFPIFDSKFSLAHAIPWLRGGSFPDCRRGCLAHSYFGWPLWSTTGGLVFWFLDLASAVHILGRIVHGSLLMDPSNPTSTLPLPSTPLVG